jgi:broad specificity phosphatase PhoE
MRLDPDITVYYVRHGETDWNAAALAQGHSDIPLNAKGRGQAQHNAERLKSLLGTAPAIPFVSSPLTRARQTMEIVRAGLGLPTTGYRLEPRLQELSFGVREGTSWPGYVADLFGVYEREGVDPWGWAPEGGESYAMGERRVTSVLDELDRDTVIVAHGGISRCIHAALGVVDQHTAIAHQIPQDRVMILHKGKLEWA